MYTSKGLRLVSKMSFKDIYNYELSKYANPDFLSNCISYSVNNIYYIRDKSQNNKIIKIFNTEKEYNDWVECILYDF